MCAEDPTVDTLTSTLYLAYKEWCFSQGESPKTQTALGRELTRRGFKKS